MSTHPSPQDLAGGWSYVPSISSAYQRDARYSLTLAAFKHTLLIDNEHIRAPAAAAAASIVGMRRAFNLLNV